jgi:phosphatidylserine/phosphatidylglycerophosphate/cardiolipin synthase-like enzyme
MAQADCQRAGAAVKNIKKGHCSWYHGKNDANVELLGNLHEDTPMSRLTWVIIALLVIPAACSPSAAPTVTPPPPTDTPSASTATSITVAQGFGAEQGFWRVFFTAPSGSSDESTYVGGIDTQLAADLASTQHTLDIAAFEFNNPVLTQAVLDAKARGVVVRMVADDDNGVNNSADQAWAQFQAAGIPIADDHRSAYMHDKFMILDAAILWTGSWNYTVSDTYRNNNNAIALRSTNAVALYQAEFNEMFVDKKFGKTSPQGNGGSFTQDGVPVQVYFGSEDPVVPAIVVALKAAKTSIRFMAFSFTLDDVEKALEQQVTAGVQVQGIFESVGSETKNSALSPLFCAGLPVRQDGNPYRMHHKVFIIDDQTVITGSFNFSSDARDSNDENLIMLTDPDLAAQYSAEFQRRWAEATTPKLTCS